jgi:bisphosphoglycerate-independent phosphoglycerate mutase (AlkP superfamily)
VRHDAYTFRFAKAHLETWKPRVLYVGFGETDDWSHDGRYDKMLAALERTDGFLREIWELLESSDAYRGKTSIIITTDHGRGNTPSDWMDHGETTEGAQYIWIAVISPDAPRRGEWSGAPAVYQSQIAATLCAFLGIDYSEHNPRAGKPIQHS